MKRTITNIRAKDAGRLGPSGFTLVEVLVVIAIIGMLVGLLLPAVMAAKTSAKRAVVKTDMTELVNALENFRTQIGNGQYPPDGTNVADLQQFCKAAWPRAAWGTTVPYPKLTPDTALCFWLGGAQDAAVSATGAAHFIGFSANPANPFDFGASRTGTLLEFDKNRLNPSPTANPATTPTAQSKSGLQYNAASSIYYNLYQYYPPNGKDMTSGTYMPYIYYKAVPVPTGSPATITVYTTKPTQVTGQQAWSWVETNLYKLGTTTILLPQPYYDSTSATTPQAFVNPQSFQLLCPGLDGIYGGTTDGSPPGSNPPQYPAGTNYNPTTGVDDMTNFTQGATVGNDTK